MTLANQVTLGRIALIPVFVWLALAFGKGFAAGEADTSLRYAATFVFLLAAALDGLDGFIARKWNQRSRLGAILDPLADKLLLMTAILVLTFTPWPQNFPLWFPILVLSRDAIVIFVGLLVRCTSVPVEVRPSGLGKIATALQMAAVAWVLLTLPEPRWIIYSAATFTLISGVGYLVRMFSGFGKASTQQRFS